MIQNIKEIVERLIKLQKSSGLPNIASCLPGGKTSQNIMASWASLIFKKKSESIEGRQIITENE